MVPEMMTRLILVSLLIAGRAFAADAISPDGGSANWNIATAERDPKLTRNSDALDAGVGPLVNVKAHGARGDGATDDTTVIQAALNLFTNGVTATASGTLYFPDGDYKITAPLIYGGGVSYGLRIYGSIGGSRGPTGSRISWHGAPGGTMMILAGANGLTIENLELNGRNLAKYGIHSTATNIVATTLGSDVVPGVRTVTPGSMTNIAVGTLLNIDTGSTVEYVYVTAVTKTTFTAAFTKPHSALAVVGKGPPSSGNVFRRLSISGVAGTGSAALAFGNATSFGTPQVSEVDMYDLHDRRAERAPAILERTACVRDRCRQLGEAEDERRVHQRDERGSDEEAEGSGGGPAVAPAEVLARDDEADGDAPQVERAERPRERRGGGGGRGRGHAETLGRNRGAV